MVRRALLGSLLAVAACKGGLFVDQGNDFPCDFSQPEGLRDRVCAPGDVCGVDNLCKKFRYEGPQFDQGGVAPDFSTAVVQHPGPLNRQVSALTRQLTPEGPRLFVVQGSGLDASVVVLELGALVEPRRELPFPGNVDQLTALAAPALAKGDDAGTVVALLRVGGEDQVFAYDNASLGSPRQIQPLPFGERLRTGLERFGVVRVLPDGGADTPGVSEVRRGVASPIALDIPAFIDGGPATTLEVCYLPAANAVVSGDDALLVTRDAMYLSRRLPPAFEKLTADGEVVVPDSFARVEARSDLSGTIVALAMGQSSGRVLSSWRLDRDVAPGAERLWSDCTPCNGKNSQIAAFAPAFDDGAPSVEVLCTVPVSAAEEAKGGLSLVRVVGSAAADNGQLCTIETVDAPFDIGEVSRVRRGRRAAELDAGELALDDAFGFGAALGGMHGQVWSGPAFSTALPLFLDRTPAAFGSLPGANGLAVPAVFTDRYAALPRIAGAGFQVLDLRTAGNLPKGAVGAAFIGQALGWSILSSGDLALVSPPTANTQPSLSFGPRLLDGRGNAALSPFFGEAATGADGGIVSFVLTANDSLYFTPSPERTTGTPNVLEGLTPQLTPAPSSPIRSFTLERSAVGTNGVDRVRAYLIAGRSLFLVTLDGAPPRWTATPLLIQGGEPIEVWMDHPLGGLGRVGYRDGEVFTLPGGFPLVNELPTDAGSKPPQVLDYENLGGWPIAMTSNGLYEAHYQVLDGGRLVNRFEDGGVGRAMNWARVTLPDGGEPWLGQSARVQVVQDAPVNGLKTFHLLVYTAQQVLEVGTLTRR